MPTIPIHLAIVTSLLLGGCASNHASNRAADILLSEEGVGSWPSNVDNKKLAKSVFERSDDARVRAVLHATSGFHYEGHAVFLKKTLLFTNAYGRLTTAKGTTTYRHSDLLELISALEKRGVCSDANDRDSSYSRNGDLLAYKDGDSIRFCLEDGGYWKDENSIHSWFWSTFGDSLNITLNLHSSED